MKVLVDTSIWSLALRRSKNHEDPFVKELCELINEYRVQIIGPIRQEILSGIHTRPQFERLRKHLSAFPDLEITTSNHENAANLFNTTRAKGIQGSNTDFLICAVAAHYNMAIFTTDKDFLAFKKYLPIKLHYLR